MGFPGITLSNKSSRDAIISVLSEQFPLPTKKVFSVLKREYGFTASYQAIHKMLNHLVEESVLEKKESGYQLNEKWVQKIKSFGENVSKLYSDSISRTFFSKEIITFTVENFVSLAKFIINDFYLKFPNPEKKSAVCLWEHTFCWIGLGEEEYANLKKIFSSCTHYAICKNKTMLDLYFSDFLRKQGKQCFCGIKYNAMGDIFVQGDFVAQVYYPASLVKELHSIYQKTKKAENFDPDQFFNIISKPNKISIVITKNPVFADYLRENLKLVTK